jgi:hypothetical protein
MTHDLSDWQKTLYDAVLWLAEELRQRDAKVDHRGGGGSAGAPRTGQAPAFGKGSAMSAFWSLVGLSLTAAILHSSAQAQGGAGASPFADLPGAWSGSGTVTLANGRTERLRCQAGYQLDSGGNNLHQVGPCPPPEPRCIGRERTSRNLVAISLFCSDLACCPRRPLLQILKNMEQKAEATPWRARN